MFTVKSFRFTLGLKTHLQFYWLVSKKSSFCVQRIQILKTTHKKSYAYRFSTVIKNYRYFLSVRQQWLRFCGYFFWLRQHSKEGICICTAAMIMLMSWISRSRTLPAVKTSWCRCLGVMFSCKNPRPIQLNHFSSLCGSLAWLGSSATQFDGNTCSPSHAQQQKTR